MKVLLDIKDSKAQSLMEVLKGLPYVKAEPLTPYKAKILKDIKEAVDELNKVRSGKMEARNAEDLLDEL